MLTDKQTKAKTLTFSVEVRNVKAITIVKGETSQWSRRFRWQLLWLQVEVPIVYSAQVGYLLSLAISIRDKKWTARILEYVVAVSASETPFVIGRRASDNLLHGVNTCIAFNAHVHVLQQQHKYVTMTSHPQAKWIERDCSLQCCPCRLDGIIHRYNPSSSQLQLVRN